MCLSVNLSGSEQEEGGKSLLVSYNVCNLQRVQHESGTGLKTIHSDSFFDGCYAILMHGGGQRRVNSPRRRIPS